MLTRQIANQGNMGGNELLCWNSAHVVYVFFELLDSLSLKGQLEVCCVQCSFFVSGYIDVTSWSICYVLDSAHNWCISSTG